MEILSPAVHERHFITAYHANGTHQMSYQVFGNPCAPLILMVHGLTRNSHDFDEIASALSQCYYVVCPDIVGRGESDWLPCDSTYSYEQYFADLIVLVQHIAQVQKQNGREDAFTEPFIWIGTSMGGILGMMMAALDHSRVHHLILNDIGPEINPTSLAKIQDALAFYPEFKNFTEAKAYVIKAYQGIGPLSDEMWTKKTKDMLSNKNEGPDAPLTLHYDKRVVRYNLTSEQIANGINLWPIWNKINAQVDVIHGQESNVLPSTLLTAMQDSKPSMRHVTIPSTAHAPCLSLPMVIDTVQCWLNMKQR